MVTFTELREAVRNKEAWDEHKRRNFARAYECDEMDEEAWISLYRCASPDLQGLIVAAAKRNGVYNLVSKARQNVSKFVDIAPPLRTKDNQIFIEFLNGEMRDWFEQRQAGKKMEAYSAHEPCVKWLKQHPWGVDILPREIRDEWQHFRDATITIRRRTDAHIVAPGSIMAIHVVGKLFSDATVAWNSGDTGQLRNYLAWILQSEVTSERSEALFHLPDREMLVEILTPTRHFALIHAEWEKLESLRTPHYLAARKAGLSHPQAKDLCNDWKKGSHNLLNFRRNKNLHIAAITEISKFDPFWVHRYRVRFETNPRTRPHIRTKPFIFVDLPEGILSIDEPQHWRLSREHYLFCNNGTIDLRRLLIDCYGANEIAANKFIRQLSGEKGKSVVFQRGSRKWLEATVEALAEDLANAELDLETLVREALAKSA